MPRSRRGIGVPVRDGVRVDGIYAEFLRRERERHERWRAVCADPSNPSAGVFRRPTDLLDALEIGEPVVVAASQLTGGGVSVPPHMRPGKARGSWWRVTADDVMERTDSPVVDRVRAPRRSAPPGNGLEHRLAQG